MIIVSLHPKNPNSKFQHRESRYFFMIPMAPQKPNPTHGGSLTAASKVTPPLPVIANGFKIQTTDFDLYFD